MLHRNPWILKYSKDKLYFKDEVYQTFGFDKSKLLLETAEQQYFT